MASRGQQKHPKGLGAASFLDLSGSNLHLSYCHQRCSFLCWAGIWGNCAVVPPPGVRDHIRLPSSSDHPSVGSQGDERGTSAGAQGVNISFQTQTKSVGKERKCTERARTWLLSSPTLQVGGPVPSKPCLLSSPIGSPAKALPPPSSHNTATGFPAALPALYRLFLYLFKT